MNLEAAKLSVYHAAKLYDDSTVTPDAVGIACNSAKFLAAEACFAACDRAVLTHGGLGYAQEYHVERFRSLAHLPY